MTVGVGVSLETPPLGVGLFKTGSGFPLAMGEGAGAGAGCPPWGGWDGGGVANVNKIGGGGPC